MRICSQQLPSVLVFKIYILVKPPRQFLAGREITALKALAWRDWPVEKITQRLSLIVSGDPAALQDYRDTRASCVVKRP